MKKSLSLFTALSTLLLATPLALATFPDVPESHPNYEAINYVQAEGIVSGHPDGNYKPNNGIDRAAFTKIIIEAKYSDEEIENCGSADFPDIPEGIWYDKYVCVAQKHNVINGYPDGKFKGEYLINLAEASKIIVNAFGYETQEDPIWYKPYILALEKKAALPTYFVDFNQNVNRGSMAEIVYRLMANVTNKPSTTYENLEQHINMEEDSQGVSSDPIIAFWQKVGECDYVKTVDFTVNEEYDAEYGAFTWTGTVVSLEELEELEEKETHVYLKVADDGSLAMEYYKGLAAMMENYGPMRYDDNYLFFQLGSLMDGAFFTYVEDINDSTKETINAHIDSGEEITLKFAQPYFVGGGGGNFGTSFSCYIGQ